jgi:uncharacterized membrane protein
MVTFKSYREQRALFRSAEIDVWGKSMASSNSSLHSKYLHSRGLEMCAIGIILVVISIVVVNIDPRSQIKAAAGRTLEVDRFAGLVLALGLDLVFIGLGKCALGVFTS